MLQLICFVGETWSMQCLFNKHQVHKYILKVSWKVMGAKNTEQMEKEIIFQAKRIKKEL